MKKEVRPFIVFTGLFMALLVGRPGLGLAEEANTVDTENAPVMAQNETSTEDTETLKLKDVVVEAQRPVKDGSAEEGYRVESISAGPLGDKKVLDTPYQINTIPGDLIENLQADSFRDVTKFIPSVQIEERGGPNVGRPQTRGFEGTVSENNRVDGMNVAITTAYPIEQFDRVEVLNGLSGSLYGPANPSGVFNFILKRPTDTPLNRVKVSYVNQDIFTGHADLGGRTGNNNMFGYRLNLLYGDGEGYVDKSTLRRKLASTAFDWHIFEDTVVEMNFSYFDYLKIGYPGGFSYAPGISLPEAPDPTTVGYGQEWAGHDLLTRTLSMRVKHDFNSDWHLTLGALDQQANRSMRTVTNTFLDSKGTYRTSFRASCSAWEVDSVIAYINGHIETGSLAHDLSFGFNGHERRMMSALTSMTPATINLGTSSLQNPATYAEPYWWVDGNRYEGFANQSEALVLGDTIAFNKSWSIILSASQSWLRAQRYNATGATTSVNNDNGISPALSVLYKPRENMTAYATYTDSLQQGATAPVGALNEGETMEPYRSEQYEAGFKAEFSKINLTTAIFQIDRPFSFTDTDNVFKVMGNQVNRGLELIATGKLLDNLTINGGITLLDPMLEDTGVAATTNKKVVGVPETQANLFIEYGVPTIQGLALNLNLHHTGDRPADDTNTIWAKGYNTIDVGARYTSKLMGKTATWRLNIDNLTNEFYWSSIFPRSTDGVSTGYSAFLGAPREILLTMQIDF